MKKELVAPLIAALSCFAVSADAANWLEACQTARYFVPSSSAGIHGSRGNEDAPDCRRIVSATFQSGVRVWRCLPVDPDETLRKGQAGNGFIIQRAGFPLQHLPHDALAGSESNFELIKVDLDQDTRPETILTVWNAQSNGMGVHNWTIYVFDSSWKLVKRFDDVADWGRSNLVKAPVGRQGCDIAITSYETASTSGNSTRTFLRARFFAGHTNIAAQSQGFQLKEASDRPVLERRYTRAFELERTTWFSRERWQWRGDSANWLNNPATRTKRPPR